MNHLLKYMILTLLVLFLLPNVDTKSQTIMDNEPWCPPGATWTYRSFSAASNLYYKFSYEKDTVLNNVDSKKIIVERIEYYSFPQNLGRSSIKVGNEYLFERNDSIFWFDIPSQNFKFIYSFNPLLGDAFIVENSRSSCVGNNNFPLSDTLYVTSIDMQTFSDRIFKVFNTSTNKNFYLGTIVSKIGSLSNPFPTINRYNCHTSTAEYGEFYEGLICYSDSIRGNIQFSSYDNNECHSVTTSISKSQCNAKQDNKYILYPNPANSILNIKNLGSRPIKQINIYSANGSLMFVNNDFQHLNSGIYISHLSEGLYIIRIMDNENYSSILKFLKK